ncbi:MAG: hypothetical protein PHE83_14990 [Opitutaceae bacterium]|nr:hypothetical protein [Opitutaceae bacterium]
MRTIGRKLLAAVLAAVMLAAPVQAYVVPTYNPNKYGQFIAELQSIQAQIKSWSEVVGAIRAQIDTLQHVSAAIYQLKDVVHESVRGLAGTLAQQTGLNEILAPLHEMQKTYTDAMYLYRDIRELPLEAQQQMAQIGFSVKDVQQYLSNGIVYDTFNRMGVDDWKIVARHPWQAFENGEVGIAIMRSEYYLGEGPQGQASRGQAWGKFVNGLSDGEKNQMGALLGPAYALVASGEWFDDMGRRVQQAADYRGVINRLADKVQPTASMAPAEPKTVVEDLQTRNAVVNLNLKASADGIANDIRVQNVIVPAEAARLEALRRTRELEQRDEGETAMFGGAP